MRWVYNETTGEREYWPDGQGGYKLLERPPGSPTPCASCPKCTWSAKKDPAHGRQSELTPANRATLELYHRIHGCGPAGHYELDGVTQTNLGIIHETLTAHDRRSK